MEPRGPFSERLVKILVFGLGSVPGFPRATSRRGSRKQLDDHVDQNVHLVLSTLAIHHGPRHDRRKGVLRKLLENLLLPFDQLGLPTRAHEQKLRRLRKLHWRIRLLAIVTLDSYYSHHPINVGVLPSLATFARDASLPQSDDEFRRRLLQVAGWLAEETYLHPRAVAVQRDYEVRGAEKFLARFDSAFGNRYKLRQLFRQVMLDGLGKPRDTELVPLLRIALDNRFRRFRRQPSTLNLHAELRDLLVSPPATYLSVDRNEFRRETYLDILVRPSAVDEVEIAHTFSRLTSWLLGELKHDAEESLQSTARISGRPIPADPDSTEIFVQRTLSRARDLYAEIFFAFVRVLLPEGWSVVFESDGYSSRPDIAYRIETDDGTVFDEASNRLSDELQNNPRGLDGDRLHELRATQRVLNTVHSRFVLVALDPVVVCNQLGKSKDEWDGAVLTIDSQEVALTIIEAKAGGVASSRADKAYAQLAETRDLLRLRYQLGYRRRRVPRLGARIRFSVLDP